MDKTVNYLKLLTWNDVETYTKYTPWSKISASDSAIAAS